MRQQVAIDAVEEAEADHERGRNQDAGDQDPECAEQLEEDGEQGDPQDSLSESGRCPSPARK